MHQDRPGSPSHIGLHRKYHRRLAPLTARRLTLGRYRECVADGLWKVPDDLAERGRKYDAQRLGGAAVELNSGLPIDRRARVIGVTWFDQ